MDVSGLAALGLPEMHRAAIRIKVRHDEPRQLPVASASHQRGLHDAAERRLGFVYQPLALGHREGAVSCGVDVLERLDPTPSVVGRNLATLEGMTQRSAQDRPYAIGGRLALAS